MKANQLFHAAIQALAPGAPIESFVKDDSAVGQMTPGAVRLPIEGVREQAAGLNTANGRITYRFHARDLHLVLAPAAGGRSVRFRVLLDGEPPSAAHVLDVDEEGHGTVTAPRLYQLIRQPQRIGDRQFEITFLDAGVEAYVFTFG
jgi:hypothetical protein